MIWVKRQKDAARQDPHATGTHVLYKAIYSRANCFFQVKMYEVWMNVSLSCNRWKCVLFSTCMSHICKEHLRVEEREAGQDKKVIMKLTRRAFFFFFFQRYKYPMSLWEVKHLFNNEICVPTHRTSWCPNRPILSQVWLIRYPMTGLGSEVEAKRLTKEKLALT